MYPEYYDQFKGDDRDNFVPGGSARQYSSATVDLSNEEPDEPPKDDTGTSVGYRYECRPDHDVSDKPLWYKWLVDSGYKVKKIPYSYTSLREQLRRKRDAIVRFNLDNGHLSLLFRGPQEIAKRESYYRATGFRLSTKMDHVETHTWVHIYMTLRRLNALISSAVNSNHSPLPRLASNRLCQ